MQTKLLFDLFYKNLHHRQASKLKMWVLTSPLCCQELIFVFSVGTDLYRQGKPGSRYFLSKPKIHSIFSQKIYRGFLSVIFKDNPTPLLFSMKIKVDFLRRRKSSFDSSIRGIKTVATLCVSKAQFFCVPQKNFDKKKGIGVWG